MSNTIYPCIRVKKGEINPRVLVVGDPARAEKISTLLENPKCLVKNREFHTYIGEYNGIPVTITSHGVGCGGAAIAFESLWRVGAKAIIRVGTCGGMQPNITEGEIIIVTGACREDGVTDKMLPQSYPAISDISVVNSLINSAKKYNINVHTGIVLTQALFYKSFLESTVQLYSKANVLAMENEVSSLLVVASTHNVKAGAILTADAPAFELVGPEGYTPNPEKISTSISNQIKIALDALINIEI